MLDASVDKRVDDEWVARQWDDPNAWVMQVDGRGQVGWVDDRLRWCPATELAVPYDPARCYFLGLVAGWPGEDPEANEEGSPAADASAPGSSRGARPCSGDEERKVPVFAVLMDEPGGAAVPRREMNVRADGDETIGAADGRVEPTNDRTSGTDAQTSGVGGPDGGVPADRGVGEERTEAVDARVDGVSGPADGVSAECCGVGGTRSGAADGQATSRHPVDDEGRGASPLVMRSLRDFLGDLTDDEVALAFEAVALARWHASAGYCPTCGTPTRPAQGGHVRLCPSCPRELFPRTDPAVIVAVHDPSDRLLLGRQASWPKGRLSVFAGFVEAGESLEQAVHRELAEEVSLRLDDVRYASSQPWPFPRSLMLAFHAHTSDPSFAVDHVEIERARWFTRADYRAGIASGEIAPPPPRSIARTLIDEWLDGVTADA